MSCGGGDEITGGLDAGAEGRPVSGGDAEPVAVPGCEPGALRGVECDVAVAHAQRSEDVALDVLRVWLAGGPLDDQPGQDVVAVGVLKRSPGGPDQRRALQLAQSLKSRAVDRAPDDGAAGGCRHPGGLLKHLAHRDAGGVTLVGKPELGYVATGGRVKVEAAGIDELHRRQRREGLRSRAEQERCSRRHAAALTGIAEATQVHHVVPGHHGDGEARHARAFHTLADDAVHPRERRSVRRGSAVRRRRDHRDEKQRGNGRKQPADTTAAVARQLRLSRAGWRGNHFLHFVGLAAIWLREPGRARTLRVNAHEPAEVWSRRDRPPCFFGQAQHPL